MENARENAIRIVVAKLGFACIKSHQLEVIMAFISGNDVFAVLPTGYGKSLCYACHVFRLCLTIYGNQLQMLCIEFSYSDI